VAGIPSRKKIAALLRSEFNIEPVELLNSTLATRKTTGALVIVLAYLLDPSSPKKLSAVYKVWNRDLQATPESWNFVELISDLLGSLKTPELFLSPDPSEDWIKTQEEINDQELLLLKEFKEIVLKWQQAALLPIDQLILTIAGDIFRTPEELSLAHKIANFQKQLMNSHPDWDLSVLLDELKSLARNERRFFSGGEEPRFNPEEHQGKVVITTAHKAKGLEWDRVYLMSVNNYNFPSGSPDDSYISEKWFIRDGLNLPAESLAQLQAILPGQIDPYLEGAATLTARTAYIRERLHLLYVSITRAKKELVITWNTGRNGNSTQAVAFTALIDNIKNIVSSSN
jgi:DNA helicase-2/ATP-dependent DNA helicase PcrA